MKTPTITISIDRETLDALDALAKKEDRPRSNLVTLIIKRYLKKVSDKE